IAWVRGNTGGPNGFEARPTSRGQNVYAIMDAVGSYHGCAVARAGRGPGRGNRDGCRLLLPRRQDLERGTFESGRAHGRASLATPRQEGACHQPAQRPQRGGPHQRPRAIPPRPDHRSHAGRRKPARFQRARSREPVGGRALIARCPLARSKPAILMFLPRVLGPATKRSRPEPVSIPCLSPLCPPGPPPPSPHTARHSAGRFGPARPGYSFLATCILGEQAREPAPDLWTLRIYGRAGAHGAARSTEPQSRMIYCKLIGRADRL